jgi:hypothetical protein
MSESPAQLQPKQEPIFTLELGSNGGTLAPTTLDCIFRRDLSTGSSVL